ncbi:MAG: hypothetical protein AAGL10_11600 [Pseudomonadota bacterium]
MRAIAAGILMIVLALAAYFLFFQSNAEIEPEISDTASRSFVIDNASEAFFPADNLPDTRRAPVQAALFYRPNQIDLGEGYQLDPGNGRLSYAFNSIGSDGRERFTMVELTNNQGYVINTSYVDDEDLIRTRVRVDPNNGLSQDATNLLDNPCFDEAIRDQNIEAFELCLTGGGVGDGNGGTIGGGGFSFPSRGSGDVTDLGKVNLNDFAQGLLPKECAANNVPGQITGGGSSPAPTPTPTPTSTGSRVPSQSETSTVTGSAVIVRVTAREKGDAAVADAAGVVMRAGVAIDLARSLGDQDALNEAASGWDTAMQGLRQAIVNSPNREAYSRQLPNIRKQLEPVSPDGGVGGIGLGPDSAPCVAGDNGPGILWQNDAICGERSQLECLAAINDPVQIITDGKCATIPGPNDQPMLVCSGRNGGPVGNGTLPTPPDPDEGCNESDSLCWTDPNSGPIVPGAAGAIEAPNYIDLIGLDHILVGLCSIGGCRQFPDR